SRWVSEATNIGSGLVTPAARGITSNTRRTTKLVVTLGYLTVRPMPASHGGHSSTFLTSLYTERLMWIATAISTSAARATRFTALARATLRSETRHQLLIR